MSNTYKHKNFGKMLRGLKTWDEIKFNSPKYFHSSSSKNAKFIIQTLGHKRRRAAERKVYSDVSRLDFNKTDCGEDCPICDNKEFDEFYDYDISLSKVFSDKRAIHQ